MQPPAVACLATSLLVWLRGQWRWVPGMQLQGGACAYNLSASCKNSSARSQAKGVPQAVGSYLFALPAVPYSLFLPSEKFTMASRMYVVKRGKPHLKHCVPEAVFFGGACRHAPTSHVQLLSLCAFFPIQMGGKRRSCSTKSPPGSANFAMD